MSRTNRRVLVFANSPRPGEVKTRLIPSIGADGAAALHRRFVDRALATASQVLCDAVELHTAPVEDEFLASVARDHAAVLKAQTAGGIGQRMRSAFAVALQRSRFVLAIGCDCPALGAQHVRDAFVTLEEGYDAVFCPAEDGGYVLIGLRHCDDRLFTGIAWSTASVLAQTRLRLRELGWRARELDTLWDVDRPADYARLLAADLMDELQ